MSSRILFAGSLPARSSASAARAICARRRDGDASVTCRACHRNAARSNFAGQLELRFDRRMRKGERELGRNPPRAIETTPNPGLLWSAPVLAHEERFVMNKQARSHRRRWFCAALVVALVAVAIPVSYAFAGSGSKVTVPVQRYPGQLQLLPQEQGGR